MIKVAPNLGIGLGLRRHFVGHVAATLPREIDWFEISPENYIGRGGRVVAQFETVASHYPIIAHGLSLSIGSLDPLNWDYLKALKNFLRRYRIAWFSDHLCFSSRYDAFLHDLFPLPFTEEAVAHVSDRAKIVQDFLEVPFALENISFYLHPAPPEMSELEFIQAVLDRSGVALMLDINNVYVNAKNHGFDPYAFIDALSRERILQLHIAGHWRESPTLIVDTHGETICPDVWDLLRFLAGKRPLPPVLIERDNNFPPFEELLAEVACAKGIYETSQGLDPHEPS